MLYKKSITDKKERERERGGGKPNQESEKRVYVVQRKKNMEMKGVVREIETEAI